VTSAELLGSNVSDDRRDSELRRRRGQQSTSLKVCAAPAFDTVTLIDAGFSCVLRSRNRSSSGAKRRYSAPGGVGAGYPRVGILISGWLGIGAPPEVNVACCEPAGWVAVNRNLNGRLPAGALPRSSEWPEGTTPKKAPSGNCKIEGARDRCRYYSPSLFRSRKPPTVAVPEIDGGSHPSPALDSVPRSRVRRSLPVVR